MQDSSNCPCHFILQLLVLFSAQTHAISSNRFNGKCKNSKKNYFAFHFFLEIVRCFSPCSTSFRSTHNPFLARVSSMYFFAEFNLSPFSPK
eukprot:m.138168 g.138168  ORF g.138168 m.138168 type:complete len:91 (+) comp13154_c4_seq6:492-764(+)